MGNDKNLNFFDHAKAGCEKQRYYFNTTVAQAASEAYASAQILEGKKEVKDNDDLLEAVMKIRCTLQRICKFLDESS